MFFFYVFRAYIIVYRYMSNRPAKHGKKAKKKLYRKLFTIGCRTTDRIVHVFTVAAHIKFYLLYFLSTDSLIKS